jgi:mannonate dehydratase
MRMHQTMRWYGPSDIVRLSDIRQAGCAGVVTALHQFAPGEVWPREAVRARRELIEAAGMDWTVVESLPVSEDIKKRRGAYREHLHNYARSLENLAAEGIRVITYNFMPVLDWIRTDVSYPMPDGSLALYFNRTDFIVFDIYLLQRPGASGDYTGVEQAAAKLRFEKMTAEQRESLFRNCLLGLPGSTEAFTPAQVLEALDGYKGIDEAALRKNLFSFLEEIVPVAGKLGLRMAIHPDDPPYPVLGLPRVVSTESDAVALLQAVPSPANGLCFCTGSYGARPDNNIPAMVHRFGDHIHFLHLRNTMRDKDGNFHEADHLDGDTDMYAVVKEVLAIQQRRKESIPMRPDHGHQMLDDLGKKTFPGYTAIGRLRGLAELRGLEYGIFASQYNATPPVSTS